MTNSSLLSQAKQLRISLKRIIDDINSMTDLQFDNMNLMSIDAQNDIERLYSGIVQSKITNKSKALSALSNISHACNKDLYYERPTKIKIIDGLRNNYQILANSVKEAFVSINA